jgi:thioredoxin reductase
VLVCDTGEPRNSRSRWVSGFLTRDGILPHDLRRLARDELAAYPSVTLREAEVTEAGPGRHGFEVVLAGGERIQTRKLILAPGLQNDVPDFPGSREFFGRGVYPCPYCDGWEHREERLVAFGRGDKARGIALELTTWSDNIVLVTHGASDLPGKHRSDLERRGIEIVETAIDRLEGDPDEGGLERVRFQGGRELETKAIFYAFEECRPSPLIRQLGCEMSETGAVKTQHFEKTNVPGLFVAGDASRRVKFAIVAAAEGAMAAFAVNTELLQEDLARSRGDRQGEAAA